MTTLVLSPRYTPDSNALWHAALQLGWPVERLQSHRASEHLQGRYVALYGESLFTNIIADQLELALLEASFDWLTNLPTDYLRRSIQHMTLGEARNIQLPTFIKPAYDKSFDAMVYETGTALPAS